jgi:hypothetical protein
MSFRRSSPSAQNCLATLRSWISRSGPSAPESLKLTAAFGCLVTRAIPATYPPIKTKGVHLLRRGRLQRTVFDITREVAAPLTNRAIAAELIRRMGWPEDDGELLDRVAIKVKDVTKRTIWKILQT